MSNPVIHVEGLSKQYRLGRPRERYLALRDVVSDGVRRLFAPRTREAEREFFALRDVSFDVARGAKIGIVGRNGAGKSTLLKILSRISEPTTGRVELRGRVASLLEVGTGFHPELTGRENIFLNGTILGMSRAEINLKFDEIVEFAEIAQFLDTPVKRYSSGMYVRLAFAVAAHLEPEILVIDEVLAVGDAQFQAKCLGKMEDVSKSGRTVLFVSHNLSALLQLCDQGILLEGGRIEARGAIAQVAARYTQALRRPLRLEGLAERVIKQLSVEQVGRTIELSLTYELDQPFRLPNFGFVIHDERGVPVAGSCPIRCGITEAGGGAKRGSVKAVMTSPILCDGKYSFSIWFDDGYADFIHLPSFLHLDVVNMGMSMNKNPAREGAVIPECEWIFS